MLRSSLLSFCFKLGDIECLLTERGSESILCCNIPQDPGQDRYSQVFFVAATEME